MKASKFSEAMFCSWRKRYDGRMASEVTLLRQLGGERQAAGRAKKEF